MRDFMQYMEDSGKCIADYCTDRLAEAILTIPHEILLLTEGELAMGIKPTFTDKGLRVSFWREFERALATHQHNGTPKKITSAAVFQGFCTQQYFYQKFITDPKRVAWMLTPMHDHQERLEVILTGLHDKIYGLTELDIYTTRTNKKTGEVKKSVNVATARLVLDAIKMIEDRVLGTAVQRTMQQNKNINITGKIEKEAQPLLPSDVDKRIAELEKRLAVPVIEGVFDNDN